MPWFNFVPEVSMELHRKMCWAMMMCGCKLQERGFCARGDSIVALHRIGNASVIKVCKVKSVCFKSVRSVWRRLLKLPEISHGSMLCRLWTSSDEPACADGWHC